jgi:hypothetical protein
MEKERLESLIIDYIDNKLNSVDRQHIEQELVSNPEAFRLYEELKEVIHVMERAARLEPSSKLKSSFDDMLRNEVVASRQTKTIFFQPSFYRAAAAIALLITGVALGFWISDRNNEKQLAEERIKKVEEELEETKRTMLAMIHNEGSASQRIQGVNAAFENIEKPDDDVVDALVKAMNEDASSNVRLAALEALSKFSSEPKVRKALVQSLSKQKDPVVQIALIQLMVKMKEKGVVNDLQKIVDDQETMEAVKDEAYSGILKLS